MFIPSSLYLVLILSHLLIILQLVEGQDSLTYTCPEEFECKPLGNTLSFPFTVSERPGCGPWLVDCHKPNPQIKLLRREPNFPEDWLNFSMPSQTEIKISVRNDCFVFQDHLPPNNETISFTISPNLTRLLKCNLSSSDAEIANVLPHYGVFSDCERVHEFRIYYNYSDSVILDYNGFPPPPYCSIIELAMKNRSFKLEDNFYDILEEISLIWSDELPWPCYKCFDDSHQCIGDQDTVHCSNKDPASKKKELILILEPVIGGGFTLIICGIMFVIWRRKKRTKDAISGRKCRKSLPYRWKTESNDYQNIENFLRNFESVPKRFKYSEIKKITSSFKNKLGQGGFGSVFKGYLDGDKNPVAIKLLSVSKGSGEEFVNEVASISTTSHVNVVKLIGFCFEYNKRALIYEYMPNGSLEKIIFGGKSATHHQLGWATLFKIAVGIARGLEYLHLFCATRMVHFDIKPHNVLLDQEFCPKISDFGLAKLCNENKSMFSLSGARGTIGYIAPEVVCKNFGGVSHKSDVYSYGQMILEMVGGRKNSDFGCDDSSQVYFPHWIYAQLERNKEIVLPSIMNDVDKESARKMILVSLWCIQTDPSQRPTMTRVVELLEGNLDILQMPPRPYLFSSANSGVADSSSLP